MKKRKNYGRKIKRNKISLYPRKKTKAQKILGTVLLIILILGIVFLGYCIGKPLLDYFRLNTITDSNSPAWTPPVQTTEVQAMPDVSDGTAADTAVPETTAPVPVEKPDTYAISVPASALSNSVSLSAFASKAAAEGYTAAIVNMKNSSGFLLYSSQAPSVKDSEAVTGTMKASEICEALRKNGLEPIAEMSVLADNEGCRTNPDMSYKIVDEPDASWYDYFSTGTPVRWSDPSSTATAEYNKAIADELKSAGFEEIITADIVFPPFQEYDKEYIASCYFAADRYKLLTGAVMADTCITVNAGDIILGNMGGTAEVLKNKASLSGNTIIIKIDREEFTAENGFAADAASLLEDVMAQCEAKCAGMKLMPMADKADFSAEEISAMREKAQKSGYTDFYVR